MNSRDQIGKSSQKALAPSPPQTVLVVVHTSQAGSLSPLLRVMVHRNGPTSTKATIMSRTILEQFRTQCNYGESVQVLIGGGNISNNSNPTIVVALTRVIVTPRICLGKVLMFPLDHGDPETERLTTPSPAPSPQTSTSRLEPSFRSAKGRIVVRL